VKYILPDNKQKVIIYDKDGEDPKPRNIGKHYNEKIYK